MRKTGEIILDQIINYIESEITDERNLISVIFNKGEDKSEEVYKALHGHEYVLEFINEYLDQYEEKYNIKSSKELPINKYKQLLKKVKENRDILKALNINEHRIMVEFRTDHDNYFSFKILEDWLLKKSKQKSL